jgi:O-antigen ligase
MKHVELLKHPDFLKYLPFVFILLLPITLASFIIGFLPTLLVSIGLFFFIVISIYSLNDPSVMLILAVISSYLGVWGALFPQEELPITIFQIFLIYSVILFTFNRIQKSEFGFPFHDSYFLIILFFGFLLFSTFYSAAPGEAIFMTITLFILFIFSIVVANTFLKQKQFLVLFFLIILVSSIFSMYSIYSFALNPDNILLNYLSADLKVFGRQEGTIGDPNQFGILLVFPILFISYELFIRPKKLIEFNLRKIFYLLLFLILFGALLVTYSRSSWLALLISIIFLFLMTGNIKRLFSLSFTSIIILIVVGFSNIFFATIINRVLSITDLSLNISNTTRVILAKAGINMFVDSHFWGNGYRSFRVLAPHYYDTTKTIGIIDNHNIIVELIADLGLVGLFLFLTIFFSILKEGYDSYKISHDELKPYIITMVTYLIALFVFYQFYGGGLHDNLMWFCFGSIFAFKNRIISQNSQLA